MPTSKKAQAIAVVLQAPNVVKSASVSLVARNPVVIITRKSDATTKVVISEAAMNGVHAAVTTALLLIQIVHARVVNTAEQEAKTEVVRKANQAENEIRSNKLSYILGV